MGEGTGKGGRVGTGSSVHEGAKEGQRAWKPVS